MRKFVAAVAAIAFSAAGFAQTAAGTLSPPAQQVWLLAPQLVPFSGSAANFDSLVFGLTEGAPITLTTLGPGEQVQVATFLPEGTLTPTDVARQLETARQSLIARGIARPTAQQLAIALVGGTLPTATGLVPIAGVLPGSSLQVRSEVLALPLFHERSRHISRASLRALRIGLARGSPITLSATTPGLRDASFVVPGGPLSAFEVHQTLQLASFVLAQQGIVDPTPDQLRVALLGGTFIGLSGASIPVRGVLQGRLRATSESLRVSTSASPYFGTSDTPPTFTTLPVPPRDRAAPRAGAPVTGVQHARITGAGHAGSQSAPRR